MSILTLPHRTLICNNKLLQYSLPAESTGATGHVSASSIVWLNFSGALVSFSVLWTRVQDTFNFIPSAMCSLLSARSEFDGEGQPSSLRKLHFGNIADSSVSTMLNFTGTVRKYC
ncbi:hypothetical protein P692DRAFT_20903067 [Suillus brevipes Sb2]|nr:hypothetical protein P692DRAFT_20903067 [Suillus brevipes Sb2]